MPRTTPPDDILADLLRADTPARVADALGLSRQTVRNAASRLRAAGHDIPRRPAGRPARTGGDDAAQEA